MAARLLDMINLIALLVLLFVADSRSAILTSPINYVIFKGSMSIRTLERLISAVCRTRYHGYLHGCSITSGLSSNKFFLLWNNFISFLIYT